MDKQDQLEHTHFLISALRTLQRSYLWIDPCRFRSTIPDRRLWNKIMGELGWIFRLTQQMLRPNPGAAMQFLPETVLPLFRTDDGYTHLRSYSRTELFQSSRIIFLSFSGRIFSSAIFWSGWSAMLLSNSTNSSILLRINPESKRSVL
jgi:hypothetical protein